MTLPAIVRRAIFDRQPPYRRHATKSGTATTSVVVRLLVEHSRPQTKGLTEIEATDLVRSRGSLDTGDRPVIAQDEAVRLLVEHGHPQGPDRLTDRQVELCMTAIRCNSATGAYSDGQLSGIATALRHTRFAPAPDRLERLLLAARRLGKKSVLEVDADYTDIDGDVCWSILNGDMECGGNRLNIVEDVVDSYLARLTELEANESKP